MRPQGETRLAVAAALIDGQGSVRQLAMRTGWSVGAVRKALDNMEQAGDVAVVATTPQPGSRRQVPVYARANRRVTRRDDIETDEPEDACADLACTLFAAWFQPGAGQPLHNASEP